jgi:uncharacterized membrane protein (UPF0127 family)
MRLSVLFFPILILFVISCAQAEKAQIRIGNILVEVEVVSTPKERQRGLMFRKMLGENSGMFFIFEREERRFFWMKNTEIPLDIAYISKDGIILEIYKMRPFSLQSIGSKFSAKFALEVNQGFFTQNGITAGDRIEILR